MICVALFGISSMLCGLAPSLPLLIFFRVLQGAGGGGLQPSEQAILADTFPPHKRGQAFAVYGMAVVLAPAIGPTLGGWITDNYNWRWIFFINVPIAILSLILTSRIVEDPPHIRKEVAAQRKRGLNLDYIGFGLLAIGFGSLQFVLDKGQENDWFGSHLITTFFVLCAAALLTLIFWEITQIRRGHRPILDLTMFRNRNFSRSPCCSCSSSASPFSEPPSSSRSSSRQLMGYTAEQAGLVISPGGLAILVLMPLVGFLVGRVDIRWLIAIGFTILSASLAALHTIDIQASYAYVAWMRIFQASGLAFLFVPINTLSYTDVPREKNNDVSGLMNLARNIGGSCGTSFFVTVLARRSQDHQDRLVHVPQRRQPAIHPPARWPRQLLPARRRTHRIARPGPRPRPGQSLPAARPPEHPACLPRRHRPARRRRRLHDPPHLPHEETQAVAPPPRIDPVSLGTR